MTTCGITVKELFDLSHTLAGKLLEGCQYPWEALPQIGTWLEQLIQELPKGEYRSEGHGVFIHKTARVYASALINGPCIIGPDAEVRHCAFIRGNALVGEGAVVGNSTELKNVILFDRVQVPHYNYVGDSILGFRSHMGAGAITSNVKSDKTNVTVAAGGERLATGLKKFGAILGDQVEVGCGSVLNPGTVVGKNSNIYPLSMVRGIVPAGSIYKRQGEVVEKR